MPVSFEYLYRDASNYKSWNSIVFEGEPTDAYLTRLRAALHDREWFIASQVRLPELFFADSPTNDDDHCWHEFDKLKVTEDAPNDPFGRTVDQLLNEFERAKAEGWKEFER